MLKASLPPTEEAAELRRQLQERERATGQQLRMEDKVCDKVGTGPGKQQFQRRICSFSKSALMMAVTKSNKHICSPGRRNRGNPFPYLGLFRCGKGLCLFHPCVLQTFVIFNHWERGNS